MSNYVLLEIGTEEIPAKFMSALLGQIKESAISHFAEEKINIGAVHTYGTPRRMTLLIEDVAEKQEDITSKNKGPSVQIAFDGEGNPTKAAMGFARGQGIDVKDLIQEDGYVYAVVESKGKETKDRLPLLLQDIITKMTFPKSMRWGNEEMRFVRPIRWIVALWNAEIIPFEVAHVQTGNTSMGHRFLSNGAVTIKEAKDYVKTMEEQFVIPDPEKRKEEIWKQLQALAAEKGGVVERDEDLLEEVTYLVEYPTALCGNIDNEYLRLPAAAVITPMKDHQRYFPVKDERGKLLPYFLTVRNGGTHALQTVQNGNERVLRARLDDAKFFFNEDRKQKLGDRVEGLKRIVFQDGLGTLHDKALRLEELTMFLKEETDMTTGVCPAILRRASMLAKADLLTGMVTEFTELQGVMGREYALLDGEKEGVAEAILEQYLPRFAGDELPKTKYGILLSLADKFDTITAIFSRGLIPTGSQDPFALRRQTIGILNIINDAKLHISLKRVFEKVLDLLQVEDKETVIGQLYDFFLQRLRNIYLDGGYDYRLVDAVLDMGWDDVYGLTCTIKALKEADILHRENLIQTYTRVGNISKEATEGDINVALLQCDEEKALYEAYQKVQPAVIQAASAYDFNKAAEAMESITEPIHQFMENVMVMVKEEDIKENRLHLLKAVFNLTGCLGNIYKLG